MDKKNGRKEKKKGKNGMRRKIVGQCKRAEIGRRNVEKGGKREEDERTIEWEEIKERVDRICGRALSTGENGGKKEWWDQECREGKRKVEGY